MQVFISSGVVILRGSRGMHAIFFLVIADSQVWPCLLHGHVPVGAVHGQWCTRGIPGQRCLTTMFRVERESSFNGAVRCVISSGLCQPGRCATCALCLQAAGGSPAIRCAACSVGVRVVAWNTFFHTLRNASRLWRRKAILMTRAASYHAGEVCRFDAA